MKKKSEQYSYKKGIIGVWDEVAPRYHKRFAKKDLGPFKSSAKIVELAKIKRGHAVLDVACGTGALTKKISRKVGHTGMVIGTDASENAIKIAKKWVGPKRNLDFIVADAEKLFFGKKFDAITCQYGIFFFPDAIKVLKNLKNHLKKNGTIAISVHGDEDTVPFFSVILDAVTKYIPDFFPPGAPDFDRFGNRRALKKVASDASFKKIKVNEFVFSYSPGSFSEFWKNYLRYIAKPAKRKLDALPKEKMKKIRDLAKKNSQPYFKNGRLIFPWKVLILTAKK
ncbi:MAG TPA: class I SAM-dependent methyltransferase [Nitrosopumilaceae archaeon]|nr:class I SAM-dependent methyltransferase [Nitrosopumilaceae archaeon]